MQLQCNETTNTTPHPKGAHTAVCVDVIDLGIVQSFYQGHWRLVPKVRLVFETEAMSAEGKRRIQARKCSASLHPKSTLYQFLSNWRGRPVVSGERIDLEKLVGASCTLVINHHQTRSGRVFSSIDAISKPTRKLAPSGQYDRAEARRKLELWKAGKRVDSSLLMANGRNTTGDETGQPRLVVLGAAEDVGF